MVVDQGRVSKIIAVLSHPLRREILILLSDRGECSFTDLLNVLKVDTGKLSFSPSHARDFHRTDADWQVQAKQNRRKRGESDNDVESWVEVADVDRKVTQLPLSSFGRRTLAFIADFLLMLTITVLFTVPQVISVVTGDRFQPELSMRLFITLGLLWAIYTA
jgi:DNA-binding transcriptional ArsR family regulator